MTTLVINWSQVGLQIVTLLFSLSILVIVHEFGHYLTAKLFKCRVEKFYLFFDPWFSIVKKKIGETVYGIGWLPLGGYVKISGMVDESMDKEQLKQPPQPWEFRSKPAWQRLIIMLAGVTMNVLLAFVIYAMMLYTWGESKLPIANAPNGIWVVDSLMLDLGLKNGDKIISVNDEPVKYFDNITLKVLIGGKKVLLERDGKQMNVDLPVNIIGQLVKKKGKRNTLILPRIPSIAGDFESKDTSYAKRLGFRVFDKIVAIDSTPVNFYDELPPLLAKHKGDSVTISFIRNSQPLQTKFLVGASGKIGLPFLDFDKLDSMGILQYETRKFGFFEAFPAGVKRAGETLTGYVDQFKLLLNPKTEAYKGLGGFKTMASIFPKNSWSWQSFWMITAFFSIALAFMNLLPIPALDGGHVLFTLIEMITGRKPSDKFLEYAQVAGMIILFALLLYANGNDWFGWGRER